MSIYTVIACNLKNGLRSEIGAPMSNKRNAIKLAEANKGDGIFCEVYKTETGVVPHRLCIYQTHTGAKPATAA